MPRQRRRLSRAEGQEYRKTLLWLKNMGVPIGSAGDFSNESTRLCIEQIDHELATIHDLPRGDLAVVVFAKLIVLTPGLLITDLEMTTPWDDTPLDLSDPEGSLYYNDLIQGCPQFPPRLLNRYLLGELPLRRRQREGAIVAIGRSSVPSECRDGTLAAVQLSVSDEQYNKHQFEFEARVNRTVKVVYERRQREHSLSAPKRQPIFRREEGQLGDQKSVSPEEAVKPLHASDGRDATCEARTPGTMLRDR